MPERGGVEEAAQGRIGGGRGGEGAFDKAEQAGHQGYLAAEGGLPAKLERSGGHAGPQQ